eukprot:SAG31_NODE_1074_length_10052_cov_88.255400_8_plen_321_part_00
MGHFKLHLNSKPGPDFTVPWPEPAQHPVPFGLSSGGTEAGTDHMRAGGILQNASGHDHKECIPGCLFNVVVDPGEQNDLFHDPTMADVIARLSARVKEAAATGPPWAWVDNAERQAANTINCISAEESGYYEPMLTAFPPPEPPPPPPPSPIPTGMPHIYVKAGQCLSADENGLFMGSCTDGTTMGQWQQGWVRGVPSLESVYLRQRYANETEGWCITTGQVLSHMDCDESLVPHMRTCYDGVKPHPSGGNPVGCGWEYQSTTSTGPGVIRAVSCNGEMHMCMGFDSERGFALVSCSSEGAVGWFTHNASSTGGVQLEGL